MTDNETNLTLLNVNQIVSLLSRAYIKLIKKRYPTKIFSLRDAVGASGYRQIPGCS